jgi:ferredoxin
MPLLITGDCIACGACDYVCPNDAIVASAGFYVIDAALCTECKGHSDEPPCVAACPVDCVFPIRECGPKSAKECP